MNQPKIKALYTYPLKSAGGILLSKTSVSALGFEYDREFAVVSSENQVITARENPKLLQLKVSFERENLMFSFKNESLSISLTAETEVDFELELFKKPAFGKGVSLEADAWFSQYINQPVNLVRLNTDKLRSVSSNYQLDEDHKISFADGFPIHLISEASVADLNSRLEQKFSPEHFRPNLIISGIEAYAEESFKSISIGDCVFDVITQTPRCSLITIDPKTAKFNEKQEPLRTLSTYKKVEKQTNFGVYLMPRNSGTISVNDAMHLK